MVTNLRLTRYTNITVVNGTGTAVWRAERTGKGSDMFRLWLLTGTLREMGITW